MRFHGDPVAEWRLHILVAVAAVGLSGWDPLRFLVLAAAWVLVWWLLPMAWALIRDQVVLAEEED